MRLTNEPRLLRHVVSRPKSRHEDVVPGDAWQLSFTMAANTAAQRAWPLQIQAAICSENSQGKRTWRESHQIQGLRQTGSDALSSSQITGTQNIKAIIEGVEGKVIAWRIRVVGRMLVVGRFQPDGYIAKHVVASRNWDAAGVSILPRDEPFASLDQLSVYENGQKAKSTTNAPSSPAP